jgi:hypothetical protein
MDGRLCVICYPVRENIYNTICEGCCSTHLCTHPLLYNRVSGPGEGGGRGRWGELSRHARRRAQVGAMIHRAQQYLAIVTNLGARYGLHIRAA